MPINKDHMNFSTRFAYFLSLLLYLSFGLVPSQAFGFGNEEKKEINKAPLEIEQVQVEQKSDTKALITLYLNLAPKHKAYNDIFEVSSKNKSLNFSKPETDPLSVFIDKFNDNKERLVLEGEGKMRFLISSKSALSGTQNFALTYQACTKDYCLLPIDLDFKASFLSSSDKALDDDLHGGSTPSLKQRVIKNLGKGSILTFLLIYFFGLMTAFTPCIYPMIPLTIGILGVSDTSSRLKGFIIGTSYALGMALVYAAFGTLVALTGGFIGQALANPIVVWGIFFFYIAMALSMFGFFEIKAPNFINQKFSRINFKGPFGAFVAGLISGLVASPCVGPVVAAILGYAGQSGNPVYGFTALFCFGLGVGTLFILMGLFYGELSSKLKPGKWVSYVKYVLGVVILLGAFLFIKPHISFLNHGHSLEDKKGWVKYSEEVVNEAKKEGKRVIIDFHASWCTACGELDEKVFSKNEFKSATSNMLLLSFDATKPSKEEQEILEKYFVIGLPTIIFINSLGEVEKNLTLTGFEEWQDFQKRLQRLK